MAAKDAAQRAMNAELAKLAQQAAARWQSRGAEITKNEAAFSRGISPDTNQRLLKRREHRIEVAAQKVIAGASQEAAAMPRDVGLGQERVLGAINDIVSIEFFERGIEAAMSVGRIDSGGYTGTGFLVGNNILLTNHHVLKEEMDAETGRFELDHEENRYGAPKRPQQFQLKPRLFWATSKELDFTFVAVSPLSNTGVTLEFYGWHPLVAREGKIVVGEGVSIIQHPGNQVKKVAVHNARLIQLANGTTDDAFCFYSCDTDRGSSGSPVFNLNWEVIALHHSAVPELDGKGQVLLKSMHEAAPDGKPAAGDGPPAVGDGPKAKGNGAPAVGGKSREAVPLENAIERAAEVSWIANEGIRISRIVSTLKDLKLSSAAMEQAKKNLLALWQRPDVISVSQPTSSASELTTARRSGSQLESAQQSKGDGATIEIPITLSVRVGTPRSSPR